MKFPLFLKTLFNQIEIQSIIIISSTFLVIFSFFKSSNLIILIVISIITSEIIFRLLLFLRHGRKYIYRIFAYYLIEDKKCGYRLRRKMDSDKLDFSIFERYAFPPDVKPPIKYNLNKKLRVKFSTDTNGYRNCLSNIKNKSDFRLKIMCSGGSTTAGQGINDYETWPSKLGEKLSQVGIDAEIFNAGVYGYDSFQELQNLKIKIKKSKPDILILHQGWNEEFAFSVTKDNKSYKPKQAKRYIEKLYFHCNNINFFPRKLIIFTMIYKFIRKKYLFQFRQSRMNFHNIKRWNNLSKKDYFKNWLENLITIKKLCILNGVKLYLVNYPCLVDIYDKPENRLVYESNSRLNKQHAIYQAFSKSRIEEMFALINKYFDVIDADHKFKHLQGIERMKYFSDEIHLTAEGEDLLAESITYSLNELYDFKNFEVKDISKEKIINEEDQKFLLEKVGENSVQLGIKLRKYIYSNKKKINKFKDIVIPTDIYTTS